MTLDLLFGIGLIAIGAFMSGSFAIPFGKTRHWAWENYWLAYGLFAYIVVPLLFCLIFCPNFITVLKDQSSRLLGWIFLLGAIYGMANLAFGLALKYLGLSLGFSLSLGLMMVLGTIIPPLIDGRLNVLLEKSNGLLLIVGLSIAVLGVLISAYAGHRKEQFIEKGNSNSDFNFTKGISAALFVGVAGSAQALGIEQGNNIANAMVDLGVNPLFQTVPVFLVIYSGSFVVTLIWCLYIATKNKTMKAFVSSTKGVSLSKNYVYCSIAGFLWFVNYIFYGMGRSRMGDFSFTAWGILMSLTIVCGTLWGLYRGEWKESGSKIKGIMYAGLLILVIASFVIGIGGSE